VIQWDGVRPGVGDGRTGSLWLRPGETQRATESCDVRLARLADMRFPLTVVGLLRRADVTRIVRSGAFQLIVKRRKNMTPRICGVELSYTVASHFKNNRDSRLNADGDGVARHWPPRGR
jgi:hypothetical protein